MYKFQTPTKPSEVFNWFFSKKIPVVEEISTIADTNVFNYPRFVNATYCPTCRKPVKTVREAECIEGLGECIRCDHVRGDL